MMKKINQARPEGFARPEIRPGDKWRDKSGGVITVTGYEYNRVTYLREGYEHPCIYPVDRFRREFTLVSKAPPAEFNDINRIMRVTGAERIRVVREIIRERRRTE
ncbi:DUF4222 domain-containing protein [Salmonella enterica]